MITYVVRSVIAVAVIGLILRLATYLINPFMDRDDGCDQAHVQIVARFYR